MSDDFNNPFAALDKRRFPAKRRPAGTGPAGSGRPGETIGAARPTGSGPGSSKSKAKHGAKRGAVSSPPDVTPPQGEASGVAPDVSVDEAHEFTEAMAGVAPLDSRHGRGVHAPAAVPEAAPPLPPEDESVSVTKALRDLVTGTVDFDLEHGDEFLRGHVRGVSPKTLAKLKAGRYSPEAHLDLHGLNALQAYASLGAFVREQYHQGRRCLLCITGRGRNSPEGQGVLRDKVQTWLTREPFRRVVLAFCTALPRHGGPGALYILLRQRKKSEGKIRWDFSPPDWDLDV